MCLKKYYNAFVTSFRLDKSSRYFYMSSLFTGALERPTTWFLLRQLYIYVYLAAGVSVLEKGRELVEGVADQLLRERLDENQAIILGLSRQSKVRPSR